MSWYRKIKLARSKTLYHGTSINNYDSIKSIGLIPDVGNFVKEMYGDYYNEDNMPSLTFATDKEDIEKAVNAMEFAVAKFLNKDRWSLTLNELKNYGMLVIIKEGENDFQQRKWDKDDEWEMTMREQYPTVEPGDYFSEGGASGNILIGNKMVDFLKRNGQWPPILDNSGMIEYRNQLIDMAIRFHINDQNRGIIVQDTKNKVNNLSDEEVKKYYTLYKDKLRERKNELV